MSCKGFDYGLAVFESLDVDKFKRILSPITLSTPNPGFTNKLNTFMDHVWNGFYTGLTRLSRFPSLILLNQTVNISWSGTIPVKTQYVLQGVSTRDWVILRQRYTKPESIQVSVNGAIIKPVKLIQGQEHDLVKDGPVCGANKFYFQEQTIEFVVTGDPNCVVILEQVNAVQVSLHMETTVEKFFEKQGDVEFIDKITAVLGVPADRVRIVSIRKGSVIVDFVIDAPKNTSENATTAEVKTVLKSQVDDLIKKVETGTLAFSAPILSLTYQLVVAPQPKNETNVSAETKSEETKTEDKPVEVKVIPRQASSTNGVRTTTGKFDGGKVDDVSWGFVCFVIIFGTLSLALLIYAVYLLIERRRKTAEELELMKKKLQTFRDAGARVSKIMIEVPKSRPASFR
eukprot:TRINITY_DN11002_c0_g1_i2.p1 TRINITY_DN11002_c0_g1~~TRINITY_DN11002_c0_g1_i2.p1  ORF type:complete len:400 (+),score=114.16 TRINITY_DN11002_c0_g1_i2:101-1300(+)